MEKNIKINLAGVASRAGVSTATVSRVLNDYPFVKQETKDRVLRVIDETRYQVNAVARNLRRKKTRSIGVIVSNVLSPFYSVIAKSVEDAAIRNGYRTILCNGGDNPEKELNYLKMLQENRVDGIILSPTGKNKEYLNYLLVSGIPVVFVDRIVDGIQCDAVLVNNREASRRAVDFLLDRNYRRIGFISGPKDRQTGLERLGGYKAAIAEHGFMDNPELIRFGDFSYESGRKCAAELINRARLDSLYAANIDMATGAFHVLKEKSIRVPENVGFIMFDDPDWATLVTPQVTTVRQPVYTIGSTASELLLKRILEGGQYLDKEPLKIVLEAKLVVRESA